VKGLALFWPFLIGCLAFFGNFVGHFWPFFTEGLAFFEKINLATLFRDVLDMKSCLRRWSVSRVDNFWKMRGHILRSEGNCPLVPPVAPTLSELNRELQPQGRLKKWVWYNLWKIFTHVCWEPYI